MPHCRSFVAILFALLTLPPIVLRQVAADEPAKATSKDEAKFSSEQIEFFQKQVQPLLANRCQKCHGLEEKIRGNLKLTSRAAVLQGGDQGPAVSLEKPEESLLLAGINYKGFEMPPSGKLPQAEIDVLTRWVKAGMPWTPGADPTAEKPKHKALVVDDAARSYWAYRPLKRPEVPKVKHSAWVANPIDAFLLTKLEAADLQPAEPADPVALVRRVYYDLTGLPPTPEEVDAFQQSAIRNPQSALETLIDRLLASPQYGQKWGRYWLDLVRFAETHGYERDNPKPAAWRYRDYVIDSFNRDKPYDIFLREQLAGDELDQVTTETLIATGYYRLGIWDDEPADRPLAKYDILDGIVSTTSQVMLGMTVGCARCHDHKKDPIPQSDYYRLLAFFRDVTDMNGKNTRFVASETERQTAEVRKREKQEREARLVSELYKLEQQFLLAWSKARSQPADAAATSDLVDLTYRFYRDTWESLPKFDDLKAEDAGPIANNRISLAPASRQEAMGLVFEGQLKVPAEGKYTFDLESTEGARLIVAGKTVIDKPRRGIHKEQAPVDLPAGLVPLRLEYFNAYEKPKLSLGWSGPGSRGDR